MSNPRNELARTGPARRAARVAHAVIAVLSAVVAVAAVGMWVRSWHLADRLSRSTESVAGARTVLTSVCLNSSGGGVSFWWYTTTYRTDPPHLRGRDGPDGSVNHTTAVRITPAIIVDPRWRPGDPEWRPWERLGFQWMRIEVPRGPGASPKIERYYGVPYWFITAAATAVPAHWVVRRWRSTRRRREKCCHACGYDLRATPGRCPECGTVPTDQRVTGLAMSH